MCMTAACGVGGLRCWGFPERTQPLLPPRAKGSGAPQSYPGSAGAMEPPGRGCGGIFPWERGVQSLQACSGETLPLQSSCQGLGLVGKVERVEGSPDLTLPGACECSGLGAAQPPPWVSGQLPQVEELVAA